MKKIIPRIEVFTEKTSPTATDTIVIEDSQNQNNKKKVALSNILKAITTIEDKELIDNSVYIVNQADNTKKAKFDAYNITTNTTRTYTLPNKNGTIALTDDINSLALKFNTVKKIITASDITNGYIDLDTKVFDNDIFIYYDGIPCSLGTDSDDQYTLSEVNSKTRINFNFTLTENSLVLIKYR